MEGTITIGIDYYTQLIEENTKLKERMESLKRYMEATESKLLYVSEAKKILALAEESVNE